MAHLPYPYPVITADQARERGISAASLMATAAWNDQRGGKRNKRQAAILRLVAAQLAAMSASNDKAGARRAAA